MTVLNNYTMMIYFTNFFIGKNIRIIPIRLYDNPPTYVFLNDYGAKTQGSFQMTPFSIVHTLHICQSDKKQIIKTFIETRVTK